MPWLACYLSDSVSSCSVGFLDNLDSQVLVNAETGQVESPKSKRPVSRLCVHEHKVYGRHAHEEVNYVLSDALWSFHRPHTPHRNLFDGDLGRVDWGRPWQAQETGPGCCFHGVQFCNLCFYALGATPKPGFLADNLWPLRAPCIGHFLLFHSCSANSCVAVAYPRHIGILRRRFFLVLVNSAVQPRCQAKACEHRPRDLSPTRLCLINANRRSGMKVEC